MPYNPIDVAYEQVLSRTNKATADTFRIEAERSNRNFRTSVVPPRDRTVDWDAASREIVKREADRYVTLYEDRVRQREFNASLAERASRTMEWLTEPPPIQNINIEMPADEPWRARGIPDSVLSASMSRRALDQDRPDTIVADSAVMAYLGERMDEAWNTMGEILNRPPPSIGVDRAERESTTVMSVTNPNGMYPAIGPAYGGYTVTIKKKPQPELTGELKGRAINLEDED